MLERLGAEAADPIDEFLNLALAYDAGAPPSLQGFLSGLREGRHEIKRDMEQGRDQVRVMTVHGAKGLEAPIVILPDYLLDSVRRSARRAAQARGRVAERNAAAVSLADQGLRQVAPRAGRARGGGAGRGRGAQPAAVRRPDAGARPAVRRRVRERP